MLDPLGAAQRAIVIADNRLPEQAVWDFDLLREHFKELIEIDFDVELTGFSTGEIDLVLDGKPVPAATDPADDLTGLDEMTASASWPCIVRNSIRSSSGRASRASSRR
jgi:hypothetical protein